MVYIQTINIDPMSWWHRGSQEIMKTGVGY